MSRVGRMPIKVPQGVEVNIEGNSVSVAGPKGELSRSFSPDMSIELDSDNLSVSRPSDSREHRSLHGLTRTLLANMVIGVSNGFEKNLEIVGVGYRVEKSGDNLVFRMGFSHTVEVVPLAGVTLNSEAPNRVKVSGIDKEAVGQMAAEIRAIRPPDSYKGKGIRYAGERVHLKPGKSKQSAK
jgi:large subunit ribosomal protein L6